MTDQSVNGQQQNQPTLSTDDNTPLPGIVLEQEKTNFTYEHLAKRPTTITETGLSAQLLTQLLIKHILFRSNAF
ncbi:hypothetical protein [Moritella sp.]|uniref:hypothetical protein n=1 Tax=Moritella sp. TaxID=78556 RepID=UPI0025EB7CE7|nr:hypothetical protein [Moritella sp.]MCJ8349974.1 hypothetical protein [Moritella sp.]